MGGTPIEREERKKEKEEKEREKEGKREKRKKLCELYEDWQFFDMKKVIFDDLNYSCFLYLLY